MAYVECRSPRDSELLTCGFAGKSPLGTLPQLTPRLVSSRPPTARTIMDSTTESG
jgi:hypothetical protein